MLIVFSLPFSSNAINGTNTYVIYAQTPVFFITGDSCTDPAPTLPPCAPAPAVTGTVRGSHSSTPSTGVYPAIMGWKGSYSNPIPVLNNVPHAG